MLKSITLAGIGENLLILLALLLFFGLIVASIIIGKRIYNKKHPKPEEKIDEKKVAEEELNRVLEPINDEKIEEEISSYQVKEEDELDKEIDKKDTSNGEN